MPLPSSKLSSTAGSSYNCSSSSGNAPTSSRAVTAAGLPMLPVNKINAVSAERMRYFCMGNALVVPMITRMGKVLDEIIEEENKE